VSFSDIHDIIFINETPGSVIDCGFKTIHSLGLRDTPTTLADSTQVNKFGYAGMLDTEMPRYLCFIYDLPKKSITHSYGKINSRGNPNTTVLLENLQPNHATILTVGYKDSGHYIVAYRDEFNNIYYYDPQANIPSALEEHYLSRNLNDLLGNLDSWGYYWVNARGTPKPVITKRLTVKIHWTG
jgi:hypothetical protein